MRKPRENHKLYKTPEYKVWRDIKYRCYNEKCHAYNRYGGRGIIMCERWLNSFADFYNDIGQRPSKGYSIDRIDVNGNYEPNNCRWATSSEQQINKRSVGKTGIKGLYATKWGYTSTIYKNKVSKYVGSFKDKQTAIKAIEKARSL